MLGGHSADDEEDEGGGMVNIFDVLGGNLDPLRNRHASADRLLTLIGGGGDLHLEQQKALALKLQAAYRGRQARKLVPA